MDNGASSYRRFLDGDDKGLAEIVRDYRDGLILYLNGVVNNISVAEELMEETFFKIITKKPKFNAKCSFKTKLYTIGRNVAIDYLRHNAKQSDTSFDDLENYIQDEYDLEKLYIMLCIVSIFPVLLLGVASEIPSLGWSEDVVCGIGLVAMFPIIAIAVAIFIRVGFANAPYEFIDKEPFETEYGVVGLVKDTQKKFRSTYVKYNYIGSCICVLSPIPFLSAAFTDHDFFTVVMLTIMLLIAGIGAMFFIVPGVRWASMQKLLKEGEYDPFEKKKSSFKETVGAIYWVVATAIFLGWSFITNDWHQSWIVWPIAGVLFVAVMMICNLIINKNQEKKGFRSKGQKLTNG